MNDLMRDLLAARDKILANDRYTEPVWRFSFRDPPAERPPAADGDLFALLIPRREAAPQGIITDPADWGIDTEETS